MAVSAEVDSLENVPESLRSEYEERDGKFYLNVTGAKTQADFDRFEEAIRRRVEDKQTQIDEAKRFNDDLKAKLAELQADNDRLKDGKSGGDEVLQSRLSDLERELKAATDKFQAAAAERDEAVIARTNLTRDTALAQAVATSGPRAEVATTVTEMAAKWVEVATDGSVKTKIDCEFGPDLTPDELISRIKGDPRFAPFWPTSRGGGAGGGDGGAAGGAGLDNNPWTVKHWNKTAQQQLIVADEARAKALANAAGVGLYATIAQAQKVARDAA